MPGAKPLASYRPSGLENSDCTMLPFGFATRICTAAPAIGVLSAPVTVPLIMPGLAGRTKLSVVVSFAATSVLALWFWNVAAEAFKI